MAPVAALFALAAAPPARAATPPTYSVTFVARQCGTYQDITANLARNNIQESLQDLGADTAYAFGQPIAPSIEASNQPNCTPLPNWQFQFGNGINGTTPGTNLSQVANPVSPPFTTQASVPLLDVNGNPTGSTIAGAVTTTLTQAQVSQAANHNLWVQGGTTTDPLGAATFGAGTHGFGALRCAVDNLNGDNVEWVGFPSGQTHVFCYYYAVTLPQPAATVTIVKQLGLGATSPETFHFRGNISYNANGDFDVSTANSITFTRASATPWNFREIVPNNPNYPGDPTDLASPDFNFASVTCTSTLGTSTINGTAFSAGTPYVSTTDPEVADLVLGAGDNTTCTYVDNPNVTQLSVFKATTGGFGGPFPITVTPPTGPAVQGSATTTAADAPVLAATTTDHIVGQPATYTISETLPSATSAGSWSVADFACSGQPAFPVSTTQTVQIPVSVGANTPFDCLFINSFTPTGSITITKTTTGGTGTTEFAIVPTTPEGQGDTADPVYSATTTEVGVPVTASQVSGDYSLDSLDLGQYSIVESGPDDTAGGSWAPQAITCNGVSSDPTSSDVLVTLTVTDPQVACAFTNAFTPTPPATTTTTTTTTAPTVAPTTAPTGTGSVAATDAGVTDGRLAATGADVQSLLGIAAALILAGATLLLVDRPRRRPDLVADYAGDEPWSP